MAIWRLGHDNSLSKPPTQSELGDDRNFFAKLVSPKSPPATNPNPPSLVLGSDGWKPMQQPVNPEAEGEFRAALALFQQEKYPEAEKAFATLAKKRKGTPWGEKGSFYVAETQFQRGKYASASESFEKLMADYPGNDFNAKVVAREFAIAQKWLSQYDPKAPPESKFSWKSRFDGTQPLFDPRGFALRALEHVRHHNPTGPLSDDAVMRIADEHMSMGDYETAAMHYEQLITDHPKSPFLQKAQLASIDARMKGYLGPEYDHAGLEKAREMVKQTMASFPDRPAGNEKLYHTLDLINDQEAENAFKIGAYYKKIGKVDSAEYYFGKVPQVYPKSEWAAKARTELASLAKMPRTRSLPSKIMTMPGSNDPLLGGQGGGLNGTGGGMGAGGLGMGGMGGMGGMN